MSLSLLMEELLIIPQILVVRINVALVFHPCCCEWRMRVSYSLCLHAISANKKYVIAGCKFNKLYGEDKDREKGGIAVVICCAHKGCPSISKLGKYI